MNITHHFEPMYLVSFPEAGHNPLIDAPAGTSELNIDFGIVGPSNGLGAQTKNKFTSHY